MLDMMGEGLDRKVDGGRVDGWGLSFRGRYR